MKKMFLLPCMVASLPLMGGELLKNGGFEGKELYPWESYPLHLKIAVDTPASGKQFLRMQTKDQPQQISQRDLSVKGGNAYSIRLQARGMDGAKAFQAVVVFSDTDGKGMGSQLLFRRVPGTQWTVYQGAFLAPQNAARAQLILQMDAAQGCVDIDDVSLADNGSVTDSFGELQITSADNKMLLLKTPGYTLSLNLERNATIDRMESDGSSRLEDVYMKLSDEKNSDRYASHVLSLLKAEKTDDGAIVTTEVTLPDMKVTRRIETFNGSPYFKLTYESEMSQAVKSPRLFVSMTLPHHFRIATWMAGKDFRSRKWTKAEWFGLIRPENPRCITFLQEDGTKGLGIAGADEAMWKSLPPSMVASARKNGGFSVEFLLSAKKDLRPGDQKVLELFLYPASGDAQSVKTAVELGAGKQ